MMLARKQQQVFMLFSVIHFGLRLLTSLPVWRKHLYSIP